MPTIENHEFENPSLKNNKKVTVYIQQQIATIKNTQKKKLWLNGYCKKKGKRQFSKQIKCSMPEEQIFRISIAWLLF